MRKSLSILINIAIAIAACLLLWVLIKRNHPFSAPQQTHTSASINRAGIGGSIPLTDVDWSKTKQTLLIVLKRDCEFCRDSAPFYRRLTEEVAHRGEVQSVVVLPNTDTGIQDYVKGIGLSNTEVRQENFTSTLIPFGVTAAPTVIIADNKGTITHIWVGQLSERYELEVTKALGVVDGVISSNPSDEISIEKIDEESLKRRIDSGAIVTVVDLRDRESYKNSHFPKARNIPGDEISSRALDELDRSNFIIVYSYSDTDQNSKSAYLNLKNDGFRNVAILKWEGKLSTKRQ